MLAGRIVLQVDFGQLPLFFGKDLELIDKVILIGLKQDTVEFVILNAFSRYLDYVVAEMKCFSPAIIAFSLFVFNRDIYLVVTL
jgi:hypothetical protein